MPAPGGTENGFGKRSRCWLTPATSGTRARSGIKAIADPANGVVIGGQAGRAMLMKLYADFYRWRAIRTRVSEDPRHGPVNAGGDPDQLWTMAKASLATSKKVAESGGRKHGPEAASGTR